MLTLLVIPFLVQAAAIIFDEWVFHLKRGLPKWERIGHPIDTASVLICFVFVLIFPYSPAALKWYIGLAAASCLLVTKDEFVHKHHCPAAEHWVHALLFLNHPIQLIALGYVWSLEILRWALWLQVGFVSLFCLYQIVYWNFIWEEPSTTTSTKN